MKSSLPKILLRTLCILLAAVLLCVLAYLAYILVRYARVEDHLALEIQGSAEAKVPVGEELTLVTYNIGFGAYSPDYSFFMDGGAYARALSRQAVEDNTRGALATVLAQDPDFALLQEVDVDGTRSHHVDQTELLREGMDGYTYIFAQNYDSPYFLYPFHEPIGANRSGIMTFSRFAVTQATRRSLPIEESLYKYLDLDRAYTVSVLETENGRLLYLYNVHLSAYTSDGTIADEQLRMLGDDMAAAYQAGHYVIAAGDFNKDLLGDSGQYFTRPAGETYTWAKPLDVTLLPEGITCHTGKNAPTCRNADAPYRGDGTDFVLSVDGVLVSDNVRVLTSETFSTGFAYSDHDPVRVTLVLEADE